MLLGILTEVLLSHFSLSHSFSVHCVDPDVYISYTHNCARRLLYIAIIVASLYYLCPPRRMHNGDIGVIALIVYFGCKILRMEDGDVASVRESVSVCFFFFFYYCNIVFLLSGNVFCIANTRKLISFAACARVCMCLRMFAAALYLGSLALALSFVVVDILSFLSLSFPPQQISIYENCCCSFFTLLSHDIDKQIYMKHPSKTNRYVNLSRSIVLLSIRQARKIRN